MDNVQQAGQCNKKKKRKKKEKKGVFNKTRLTNTFNLI